ncbi:putative F-box/kelch-repeat protein At4g22430 [Castanea sativa]|uniref:putative F-box/kelch-repeat protein At4g22430 n=1 Tax=Castanea sativa TaxID=21020 RepID=UPI003F64A7F5
MALESSAEVSLLPRRKIRKENPEENPIQTPCRKRIRRIKHRDEPEPSHEFFNTIPDSMLLEILYRLPCRTVHQSKSVSKSWYSLISNPLFACSFIHHHHQDSYSDSDPFNLLVAHATFLKEKTQVLPSNNSELSPGGLGFLNFLPRFKHLNLFYKFGIIASFNDLLLVYRRNIRRKLRPPRLSFRKYYICNPLTKQWLKLPLLRENRTVKVGFICDAHNCDKNAHYRYKVVVLVHSHNEPNTTQLHMEIFSSEIGKWCKSVVSSPRVLNPVRDSFKGAHDVVACNGKLHWMDIEENGMIKGFVVFDPFNDAKRCHYIELPKNLPPDLSFGAFRCRH